MNFLDTNPDDFLCHHGIKGQRWGVRNGPPYPLDEKSHSTAEHVASANPEYYRYAQRRAATRRSGMGYNGQGQISNNHKKRQATIAASKPTFSERVSNFSASQKSKRDRRLYAKYKKQGMSDNEARSASETHKKALRNALIVAGGIAIGAGILKLRKEYGKRYIDTTIKKGQHFYTLTNESDRIARAKRNNTMFYTNPDKNDLRFYQTFFNPGQKVGNKKLYKYKNDMVATKDMKVASDKAQEDVFLKLYKKDKGFRDFVANEDGMESFMLTRQKTKSYRPYYNSLKTLNTIRGRNGYSASEKEIRNIHKLYNFNLGSEKAIVRSLGDNLEKEDAEKAIKNYMKSHPNTKHKLKAIEDSRNKGKYVIEDTTLTNDINKYKKMYFDELKKKGYSGILDSNDALYGHFHGNRPTIIFDNDSYVLKKAKRTSTAEKKFSTTATWGRKIMPYVLPVGGGVAAYKITASRNSTNLGVTKDPKLQSKAKRLYSSGMSQEEIAKKLGISVSSVNAMLN